MKIKIWGYFFLSIFVLVGCQNNSRNEATPYQKSNDQFVQVKDSSNNEQENIGNEQLATHLANVASSVPNVNGATAIVLGPYAVVGIDVDGSLDRSRVGTIKFSVSEALQHDPYGKTAVVIADADISDRIRLMNEKIRQGHPIMGVLDELAAIVGRYMPDFPVPEDYPENPEQNDEMISDDEEEQLDRIEKENSQEK